MKKKKIVFISNHSCMRMNKTGICLMDTGRYELHLITNKVTQYSDLYKTVMVYQNVTQMRDAILQHKDAALFHAHNEPSWFVTAAKEALPKIPVVLDVHDSILLRRSYNEVEKADSPDVFRVSADERNNFQLADGLVFVNSQMKEIVSGEFGLEQPSIVLPSAVPQQFYRIDFFKYQKGLCYEGRIDVREELKKEWEFFSYCDYIDLCNETHKNQIPFYIYTTRKDPAVRKAYGGICKLAAEPLSYTEMIRWCGSHDWGLVGNMHPYEEWKNALPNKLFEYMASCLPIVCWNADASWDFIKDTGFGIKVESLDELIDRWAEHRKCRMNIIKNRGFYCLENYIPDLEGLYDQLLG